VLATAATVIASQAVITGAYSLVHQAIQLGMLPRLAILHTSAAQAGQIYIPRVTAILFIGVISLVAVFKTSSALASAYGIAVTTTMVVDGALAFIVVWKLWRWPLWRVVLVIAPLVVVDFTFFSANLLKLFEGAWAPLLFGASMVLLILTWRRGTNILMQKTRRTEVPLDTLLASLEKKPPHVVPGTAVFLTGDANSVPTALSSSPANSGRKGPGSMTANARTTDTWSGTATSAFSATTASSEAVADGSSSTSISLKLSEFPSKREAPFPAGGADSTFGTDAFGEDGNSSMVMSL